MTETPEFGGHKYLNSPQNQKESSPSSQFTFRQRIQKASKNQLIDRCNMRFKVKAFVVRKQKKSIKSKEVRERVVDVCEQKVKGKQGMGVRFGEIVEGCWSGHQESRLKLESVCLGIEVECKGGV